MDPPDHPPTLSGRIHSLAGISFLLLPPAAFLIEWPLSSALRKRVRGWILAWSVLAASCLLLVFNGFLVNLGVGGIVQRGYWFIIIAWLFLLTKPTPVREPLIKA